MCLVCNLNCRGSVTKQYLHGSLASNSRGVWISVFGNVVSFIKAILFFLINFFQIYDFHRFTNLMGDFFFFLNIGEVDLKIHIHMKFILLPNNICIDLEFQIHREHSFRYFIMLWVYYFVFSVQLFFNSWFFKFTNPTGKVFFLKHRKSKFGDSRICEIHRVTKRLWIGSTHAQ